MVLNAMHLTRIGLSITPHDRPFLVALAAVKAVETSCDNASSPASAAYNISDRGIAYGFLRGIRVLRRFTR
jgi:hypothetical protein